MHGLGTIVNVAAIVAEDPGLLGGRRVPERLQENADERHGRELLFVGVSGTLSQMLRAEGGALTVQGDHDDDPPRWPSARFWASCLISRTGLERFRRLAQGQDSESDGGFIGAFRHRVPHGLHRRDGHRRLHQDGILGDHATLFAKAVLDLCDHHGHDGLDGQGLHLLRHPGRHPAGAA